MGLSNVTLRVVNFRVSFEQPEQGKVGFADGWGNGGGHGAAVVPDVRSMIEPRLAEKRGRCQFL